VSCSEPYGESAARVGLAHRGSTGLWPKQLVLLGLLFMQLVSGCAASPVRPADSLEVAAYKHRIADLQRYVDENVTALRVCEARGGPCKSEAASLDLLARSIAIATQPEGVASGPLAQPAVPTCLASVNSAIGRTARDFRLANDVAVIQDWNRAAPTVAAAKRDFDLAIAAAMSIHC